VAIAQRLKKLMAERGWTQMDFARELAVSQRGVSYWLSGKSPKSSMLNYLAEKFGVNPAWLEHGIEPREATPLGSSGQALAPAIHGMLQWFEEVSAKLSEKDRDAGYRRFRELVIDPLCQPERMVAISLGIPIERAKVLVDRVGGKKS
jgi:transcriptional regulator with XRE-family HTH domain